MIRLSSPGELLVFQYLTHLVADEQAIRSADKGVFSSGFLNWEETEKRVGDKYFPGNWLFLIA